MTLPMRAVAGAGWDGYERKVADLTLPSTFRQMLRLASAAERVGVEGIGPPIVDFVCTHCVFVARTA
jgi:hypothetical protein